MLHRKTMVFILTLLLGAPVYAFAPATKAERACDSTAQCTIVAYGCDGTVSVNELAKGSVTARYHKEHGNPAAINCIKTAYQMGPAICTEKQCEIRTFAPATKAERTCESTAQCVIVAYGCDGTVSVNKLAKASVTARYHNEHGNPAAIKCSKTAYQKGPTTCTKKQCDILGSNMGILFNLHVLPRELPEDMLQALALVKGWMPCDDIGEDPDRSAVLEGWNALVAMAPVVTLPR